MQLQDGPVVTVPFLDRPANTLVDVEVLAEELLLARSPIGGLTARNVIAGVIRARTSSRTRGRGSRGD